MFNAGEQSHAARRGNDGDERLIAYVSIIEWKKFLPAFPEDIREAKWAWIKNKRGMVSHAKSVWKPENAFTSEMPINLESGHHSKLQPVLNPMALLTAMVIVQLTRRYVPAEQEALPIKRKLDASGTDLSKRFKGVYMRYLYLIFLVFCHVLCIINNKFYI